MKQLLLCGVLIAMAGVCIAGDEYTFGVGPDGFLPPARRGAYGPGIDADATGRPFYWAPRDQPKVAPSMPDPTLNVAPDAYGLGVGSDQYGRPVERKAWPSR